MARPTWDETFMEVARVFARRSACKHYQVGAVFVRGKNLLQVGYNGPTKGLNNHCIEIGCAKEINNRMLPAGSKMCRGAHAEMNAIANAASLGVNLSNSTVYCAWSPCYDCAKHLVNLGIVEFVYADEYKEEFPQVKELFKEAGIKLRQF